MRKYFILLFALIPFINVNALSCYETTKENPINDKIENFECTEVEGETITFKHNNEDYSKYFKYTIFNNTATIEIVDKKIPFATELDVGIVVISDGKNSNPIYIKNTAYVKPTETTSTTTTKANEITYKITLDNKGKKEEKTCSVTTEGDTCSVTLPNLETENFTGWGKASTCKEGNIGSERINSDITYYACYSSNEQEENTNELLLKGLKIIDATTKEEINFGTFSIKKKEYEFKVLHEVEKLEITASAEDNITIDYEMEDNLEVGDNKIIIKLTDENNNTNEYKLTVTRLDEGETINNTKYLKSLVIGGYTIDFNPEVFVYNLTIPSDVDKLVINPVPQNENDVPEIRNNNNLENGSVIEIILGSGEETTIYSINITKENNNILLLSAIGVIILLIIILIILIIIKRKNKKKTINNNSKPETIKQNENLEVLEF